MRQKALAEPDSIAAAAMDATDFMVESIVDLGWVGKWWSSLAIRVIVETKGVCFFHYVVRIVSMAFPSVLTK